MTSLRSRLLAMAASTVALTLVLTGCGGGDAGPSSSTGAAANSVIVVIDSDPESLNPGLTTATATLEVQSKLFEGLIYLDKEGKAQPQLATKWEVSADQLTYTFTLREGVKWHDGQAFTADDVKWSLETGLKENARAQGVIKQIASIIAPDAKTVVIKLTKPYAPFLQQMKVFDTPILPKHVYGTGDIKTNPANRAPIGTGPFKFSKWDAGQKVTLVKNPTYWTSGEPKLTEVIFQIIPEAQNRVNSMLSGEVDILPATMLPQANIKQLDGQAKLNINRTSAIPSIYFMMMNSKNAMLAKPEVRQAIAAAVDRPRIVAQAMGGLASPGYGAFGDGFAWAKNADSSYDKLYPLNPAAAKTKLEAAGAAGTTLRITYDSARPVFVAAAQIIKDNLTQVGITVTLEPLERSVYSDKVYVKRDFDLALQSFTSSGDPAIGYHRLYVTNNTASINVNPTGFSDPAVDALLAQAGGTADQAVRGPLYKQAATAIDKAVPTLVLLDEKQADVNSTRVQGMYSGLNPSDMYQKISIKP